MEPTDYYHSYQCNSSCPSYLAAIGNVCWIDVRMPILLETPRIFCPICKEEMSYQSSRAADEGGF